MQRMSRQSVNRLLERRLSHRGRSWSMPGLVLVCYALVSSSAVSGASRTSVYTLSQYPQAPSLENVDKDPSATAASGAPLVGEDPRLPSWADFFSTTQHQGAPVTSIDEGSHYASAAPVHSKVPYIVRSEEIPLATSSILSPTREVCYLK